MNDLTDSFILLPDILNLFDGNEAITYQELSRFLGKKGVILLSMFALHDSEGEAEESRVGDLLNRSAQDEPHQYEDYGNPTLNAMVRRRHYKPTSELTIHALRNSGHMPVTSDNENVFPFLKKPGLQNAYAWPVHCTGEWAFVLGVDSQPGHELMSTDPKTPEISILFTATFPYVFWSTGGTEQHVPAKLDSYSLHMDYLGFHFEWSMLNLNKTEGVPLALRVPTAVVQNKESCRCRHHFKKKKTITLRDVPLTHSGTTTPGSQTPRRLQSVQPMEVTKVKFESASAVFKSNPGINGKSPYKRDPSDDISSPKPKATKTNAQGLVNPNNPPNVINKADLAMALDAHKANKHLITSYMNEKKKKDGDDDFQLTKGNR